jgi:hypothetical protein
MPAASARTGRFEVQRLGQPLRVIHFERNRRCRQVKTKCEKSLMSYKRGVVVEPAGETVWPIRLLFFGTRPHTVVGSCRPAHFAQTACEHAFDVAASVLPQRAAKRRAE